MQLKSLLENQTGNMTRGSSTKARTPRGTVDKSLIIDAAYRVANNAGIESLTMRRVAAEICVEAMALYRYFPNKDALLLGLVETFAERVRPEYQVEDGWQGRIMSVMQAFREVALQYPQIFMLSQSRDWGGKLSRRFNPDLETLRDAGFDEEQAARAVRVVLSFVTGFIQHEIAELIPLAGLRSISESNVTSSTADHCPSTTKSYWPRAESKQAEFKLGLEAVILGLQCQHSATVNGAR